MKEVNVDRFLNITNYKFEKNLINVPRTLATFSLLHH